MRRSLVLILIVIVAGLAACSNNSVAPPNPVTTTTVAVPKDFVTVHVGSAGVQKIEGFGASGAWWPIDVSQFPKTYQDNATRILFYQLNLSGYRYNIGGGGKGVKDPQRAPKQVPDDTAGLTFFHAAADAHVPALTGFVNSAPPQFTTNGLTCGGALKPGSERAYAQYLVDMVKLIHDREHITLNYLSPMNEPDDSFPACGQEGMAVPVAQRAPLVQAVGKLLAEQAPYTKVIADESSATFLFTSQVPKWMSVPGTAQYVDKLVHHTYEYPSPALLKKVPAVAKQFGKSTWMTEICCYSSQTHKGGTNYDPTMTQGLWLADDIYNDLTIAGDSAYYWWTAFSPKAGCDLRADPACGFKENQDGQNDGLAYFDPNYATSQFYVLIPTKRLEVFTHFSHDIRPGAMRHDVTAGPKDVRVMAFTDGDTWTVLVWNSGTVDRSVGIAFPKGTDPQVFGPSQRTAQGRPTTPAANPGRASNGSWYVPVPAQTITTYTFK